MDPTSWKQAKDVIVEAFERPPGERELFVRRRCADPTVSAEILEMLKDWSTMEQFLASLPRDIELEERDDLGDLQPGTRIGQYVILDRLGQGGMGQVFLSRDQELRRKVALKCLLSSGQDSELERARILREARAAAAINHANIATVHHVIEQGDRAFIVMEYVEGESLAERLKRERLTVKQVIAIGSQLAAALAAAHARGVIHRDLKPANVQIAPDGSVKVLDFGVARFSYSLTPPPGMSSAVPSGPQGLAQVAGTPPYMSPEQLLGRHVDERSDIYSLGVVLFEMATGRRPYLTRDRLELIEAQAKGAPRVDAVDDLAPNELADVIANTLVSDPARRYQSALEVKSALEEIERHLQVTTPERLVLMRRWLTRVGKGAPVAILALGVAGFITTTGFNNTFGRVGGFARFGVEPWPSYFSWGLLATFPSVVMMTLTAIIVLAARFLFRILDLIGPIGRATAYLRDRYRGSALAVGLHNPAGLAQTLTVVAVLMLIALCWWQADLIRAWTSLFNSSPIENLLPMGPRKFARLDYKVALDVMTLGFGFGLFKVIELRNRRNERHGNLAIGLLAGIVAVLILMNEWSYRILSWRDFERVEIAGVQCYITGESADEFLILCPSTDPPRNRTRRRDDSTLHRTGVIENVFEAVYRTRPDR
jgi:predicted Ser/Thr protein kinase